VAFDADACPSCGKKKPAETVVAWVVLIVIAAVIWSVVGSDSVTDENTGLDGSAYPPNSSLLHTSTTDEQQTQIEHRGNETSRTEESVKLITSPSISRVAKVVGVEAGDTLNVRSSPSVSGNVLGELHPDAVGIVIYECVGTAGLDEWWRSTVGNDKIGATWCKISYREISGWANAWYLMPE